MSGLAAGSGSPRLAAESGWSASAGWLPASVSVFLSPVLCRPQGRAMEQRLAALLLPFPVGRVQAPSVSVLRKHSSYPGHLWLLQSKPDSHFSRLVFIVKHLESDKCASLVKKCKALLRKRTIPTPEPTPSLAQQ